MANTEPLIRRATEADAEALGRLGALLVQEHHDFDPSRFIKPSPDTPKHYGAFLASQVGERGAVIVVAEREGRVIGYAFGAVEGFDYMTLRGPAALVHDLIVDPDHRGGGVGRLLLDALIAALTADGVPRIVLSTAEKNTAAQKFFARQGFRRTMIEMTKDVVKS